MAIGIVEYKRQPSALSKNYDDRVTDAFILKPNDGVDGSVTKTQAGSTGSGAFLLDGSEDAGVYVLAAGAATDGNGINAQWKHFHLTPAAGTPIYFEIECKAVGRVGELFIGLAKVDSTLITGDAITNECVGFAVPGDDDGVLDYVTCDDTTFAGNNQQQDGETLEVGTKVRLAMEVYSDKVKFYRDGVLVATNTTNIPTDALCPSIVCQSIGTTESELYVYGMSVRKAAN
jgi:hypothetical protein